MNIKLLCLGIITGFTLFAISTKHTGQKTRYGLMLEIYLHDDTCLHIHHWMILTIIMLPILAYHVITKNPIGNVEMFAIGFCVGGIIQGMMFTDRFNIKEKCIEQFTSNT